MCKAVEDYANEKKLEGIKEGKLEGIKEGKLEGKIEGKIESSIKTIMNLLKDGMSLDKALTYAELDKETYEKYASPVQQT